MRWMWGGVQSDVISSGCSGEGTVKKPLGLHPKPSGPPGSSTSSNYCDLGQIALLLRPCKIGRKMPSSQAYENYMA